MTSVGLDFLGIGCNRHTTAAAWGHLVVAFGAHHMIALYLPFGQNGYKIIKTLHGHKGMVNVVKIISQGEKDLAIVSGSADKTIRIWTQKDQKWESLALEGHTDSIIAVSFLATNALPQFTHLIGASSSDGTLSIWGCNINLNEAPKATKLQVIEFKTNYSLALDLSILPHSNVPIMASGNIDGKVSIFVLKTLVDGKENHLFEKVVSLEGHEDWVRCLAFTKFSDEELILASGSQDRYIRLWQISSKILQPGQKVTPSAAEILESISIDGGQQFMFSSKGENFTVETIVDGASVRRGYSVLLDAMLIGHEDWVCGVYWHPIKVINGKQEQVKCLVSASMDKSMMIWRPDQETGLWINQVRLGEMGGQNTLGFFGAIFDPEANHLLCHGYNGAFHLWSKSVDQQKELWQPNVSCGGHFGPVQDFDWSPSSNFLISVSADQTSRLISQWKRKENDKLVHTWHEIARPQIHGHDLECIAFTKEYQFASGAEEKVVRVFDAPQSFLETLSNISLVTIDSKEKESRPLTAATPALGLSNKPIFEGQQPVDEDRDEDQLKMAKMGDEDEGFGEGGDYDMNVLDVKPVILTIPPFEEHLLVNTLWAETEKLYGHPYEIFCLAANHSNTYLASASKATHFEHAHVRLWSIEGKFKPVGSPIGTHSLTVTQLSFSNSDKYLLSVSRDRSWAIFESTQDPLNSFKEVAKMEKAQTRILWTCAWAPDYSFFATGSRDKTIKFWETKSALSGGYKCLNTLTLEESVTALDLTSYSEDFFLLATGLENGLIQLFKVNKKDFSTTEYIKLDRWDCHSADVKRLRWRRLPLNSNSQTSSLQLASCALDHSVRIFNVPIEK